MPRTKREQYQLLGDFLETRRGVILQAWRKAIDTDPQQTTAHVLSRGQLNDHIPQVLEAFEQKLCASPGGIDAQEAETDKKLEEVKHGLHRWQQGYRLPELVREWGHLQLCLFDALGVFAAMHPEVERDTMADVHRQTISLINGAIIESNVQYERMQQAEASGRMRDLEEALARINEIEQRRANLIREAVHDLHGNLFGVTVAAKLLGGRGMAETDRAEAADLLNQGVRATTAMLEDLKELARLEAGVETREIIEFDAGALVAELGNANRPIAEGRGLFLEVRGPRVLSVEGDPGKVRRLLQNLLMNALKYTERGGVTISLGLEGESWWVMLKDTGPGILDGPGSPLVAGIKEATASARESDEKAAATTGEISHVLAASPGGRQAMKPMHQPPGEGIGLSIVKRLCELLDASLEMKSSGETGTTFRVLFPLHFRSATPASQATESS